MKGPIFGLLVLALMLILGLSLFLGVRDRSLGGPPSSNNTTQYKTVHPKQKADFGPYIEQPATVEAYYNIDIYSDVSGQILSMPKEVGQVVVKNDVIAVVAPSGKKAMPTTIVSPLSGILASRNSNPGDFAVNPGLVPGASSIASVLRKDIVTITVQVPDTGARRISLNTPTYFRPEGYEGNPYKLSISRITPALKSTDRTISIEMDVFNLTESEYLQQVIGNQSKSGDQFKGGVLPQFPEKLKGTQQAMDLMPGTYGQVRFDLKSNAGALAIPVSCIVMQGGLPYVFKVESGKAIKRAVEIIDEDGLYVSASWVSKDPQSGMKMTTAITTEDEVILNNQEEIEEGENLSLILTEW